MTAYIFQTLATKGTAEGIDSSVRQRDARTWMRDAAQQITNVNKQRMMNDRENVRDQIKRDDIGRMFMFFYDPKLKKTLPYYDTFPLIFPIGFMDDGFLGINLHYLPPMLRAKLMDSIYETRNNTKYDASTKLNISYSILARASKYRYFKPCVKHYLWTHVRSKYLNIEPRFWDACLMLPTERFQKATKQTVWKDSQGMF